MPSLDAASLRIFVYDEILARGRPPTSAEIGARFNVTPAAARDALAGLGIGKTILTDERSGEIWMAGPFSAVQTPYRVVGAKCAWSANCAWDMFGVAAIAQERVTVQTQCGDCGDPMTVVCNPSAPPNEEAVVHFLLPARPWYEDIGFT